MGQEGTVSGSTIPPSRGEEFINAFILGYFETTVARAQTFTPQKLGFSPSRGLFQVCWCRDEPVLSPSLSQQGNEKLTIYVLNCKREEER